MTITIAPGLDLPIDAVTETFAIMAKRGVGKTYTGSVLAEEMLAADAQVVVIDPLDAWWGLRSSADGKGAGLPIYVFGGQHADLPLEAGAGELLANVVVDHGASVILSLRHLTKTKQRTFVTEFAERLYHRKGEPEHRTPLHVFFDEADAFVPQHVMGDTARMVGAVDDIVRRGRNAGLGATLISQRAAVVNKDVLSQCEVLIALQTIDVRDRKALEAWIEAHDALGQSKEFMASLAALAIGEAWVWSPAWLDIFQRVRIRRRRTFDSSATPKAGQTAIVPTTRAPVDLGKLGEQMAATAERAKADDPRELRRQIGELEKSLKDLQVPVEPERIVERVEVQVPVLNGEVDRLQAVAVTLGHVGHEIADVGAQIIAAIDRVAASRSAVDAMPVGATDPAGVERLISGASSSGNLPRPSATSRHAAVVGGEVGPRRRPESESGVVQDSDSGNLSLGKAERAILTSLAGYPIGLSREQLAFLADYHPRSKGYINALGALRGRGLISPGFPAELTADGALSLDDGPVGTFLRGDDLAAVWIARFGRAEAAILRTVIDLYPHASTREDLAEAAGFEHVRSKGFINALGRLRGLGLVDGFALHADFARLLGR